MRLDCAYPSLRASFELKIASHPRILEITQVRENSEMNSVNRKYHITIEQILLEVRMAQKSGLDKVARWHLTWNFASSC